VAESARTDAEAAPSDECESVPSDEAAACQGPGLDLSLTEHADTLRAHAETGINAKASASKSRYIPRKVLREVYARDLGQCTFVSPEGRRCAARGFLEVHHHNTTFARGGEASAANLRLTCRVHNALLAERDYGRAFMKDKLRAAAAQRTQTEHSF
jgi:hypothetical protein